MMSPFREQVIDNKRRRVAVALLLFVAIVASAPLRPISAQTQPPAFREEWAVGVTGGINYSSVFFSPKVHQSMLQGFGGNVAVRWITERHLGLQLEAGFRQIGWKERFDEQPQYRYIRRMNYMEMPFLTHIYFGNERVRFIFNLGPQIGLLLGESTDENLHGATPNKTNDQHTMTAEKRFAWGLCGGPGVELRTSIGHFQLEGRYYYSLGDFYSTRHGDVFSKASPQVFTLRLGYFLPFAPRR